MTETINPEIFREYDIRGLVDKDLTQRSTEQIGKGIGTYIRRNGGKTLTVGYDMRISSIPFRDNLICGLNSTGCDVIDIGMVPTPVAYFSLHHLKPDGGVMITGSHNPSEFNGFKISNGLHSLYGESIQELRRLIDNNDFELGSGELRHENILEDYIQGILDLVKISRSVKVVVDGGNGCFGIVGPKLLKKIGANITELYCEPDGNFPNHHPDPTVEKNMLDLSNKVKETGAELGIGFDGDADRIGIVDEEGKILWGDQLLMIFARNILKHNPGATIVGEVKCSQNLFKDVEGHGGTAIMSAAGHSLIKKKMQETNALLAGEMSGHICFADEYYGFDDAIYAACRILQIVASSKQKVSEMLADIPKMAATPEIRVDCPDDHKFKIVGELTEEFRKGYEVIDIDGVRINFDNGWALIRASNTQPAIVFRFEANNADQLDEIIAIVRKVMTKYEPIVTLGHELC
ncbi:MAG TPA: phosphomannomutase/phosphoglucomutase [Nitrospinaceae bacterium]|jgi:phosphomannomutase/phosphoglucomutase|nr:phosphomannomutase/phosphoglucomutase [Gammaproteobacteria bacterium]HIA32412.1 phosphomannomutase/phosphoglucomutase [Nitrospinaceae bacterium]HIB44326.1 phosphomannomutase/phosphoglucomutase [Nitrospina sp.]HIN87595.1 phosphomannomutase/phosphoglucomutase [Nitrospinaceae bacterium]|tara:strand:+ start:515 stop:1900 length:1386 start_codon:yes stop_codon:yes gene_type:complete